MKLPQLAPDTSRRVRFTVPTSTVTPILCGPLHRPRFVLPTLALLAGASLFSSVPAARAATKYWEPTGSTGTNASGTWNTTSTSWTTDSTGASGPNTTFGNSTYTGTYSSGTVSGTYTSSDATRAELGDDAVFSADPAITGVSTVTLGLTLAANSVTFGDAGVTNGGAAAGFTFAPANILLVGNFAVTGANTYTGNTAITLNAGAGPVIFNNQVSLLDNLPDAAGASTISYSIANNSASALTFNGLFSANTRPNSTNETVNLTFSGTGGVTFNGAVTGNTVGSNTLPALAVDGGNLNLIISGGGAVALNAANSAVGSVALSNGSLTLGNSLAMQGLALNQTGGTFSFGTLATATIAGLTGTSTLTLTNTGGTGVALNDVGFAGNANGGASNPTFSAGINGLGSLTINGVQNGGSGTGGTATFSGVLGFTGAGGLTINDVVPTGKSNGASTVILTNVNTYTGPTTVTLPGGSLTLNGNGSIANTSAITLNGGGLTPGSTTSGATTTLVYDNTVNGTANRLGTAPLALNGATLNYKAVTTGTNVAGTGSSGAITVGGALTSTFNFAAASGTSNTSNFTIASLANTNHGTLSAFLPGANTTVGIVTVTAAPALINGILPWTYETSNGNFLSVNASNQLNAFNNVGTDATAFNNTATSNVKIGAAQAAFTGATAENSLIYNVGSTQAFGGNTLTLTSGGLALTANGATLGSAANDGTITTAAANPELYVNATSGNSTTINSTITNAAGGTSVALTKFGAGTLNLTGTNTYTGPTTVEQGTLTNLGTIGALVIAPGATATLFGTSTTGAVTANGTLGLQTGTLPITTANVSGTGGTGSINYLSGSAASTVNFSGTNSFLGLNNTALTANGGQLILAGPGSVNTFAQFPGANAGLTTTTTTFQSGTYFFTAGGSNVYANNLGTFNVSGANVTFTNGLNFAEGGGGTITVNSGLLQTINNFNTNQQTSGTTINYNVKGGVFDVVTTQANIGNEGGQAAATSDNLNVSGGIFQAGFTASTGGQNLSIGGSNPNVLAAVNLSAGGTIRDNGTIQGGNTPAASGVNQLNLTGGTLTASTINMSKLGSNDGTNTSVTGTLYNGGTIIAPGYFGQAIGSAVGSAPAQFSGKTTITGNYQVDSTNAALAINLGGTGATGGFGSTPNQYDNVSVSGTTVLNGRLNVGLTNGFTPTAGNTFNVLTSTGAISGNFDNYQVAKSGAANVIAAGGTGSFSVAVPTAAAGSVVLSNFVAGNTYTGNSTNWNAANAASWSVYDPGSSTTLATPAASGAVAVFGNGDTTAGAATVPLSATRNVAGILFNSTNTGATNYTISQGGSGAIILDNTANSAQATITDSSAAGNANAINVPITLNSPLAISVTNAANTLTLGGAVSGAQAVTTSGAGAVLFNGTLGSSATPAGMLSVTAGTLGGTGTLTVASATVSAAGTLTPGMTIGATTGALTLNTTSGLTINGNLTIGLGGAAGANGSMGTYLTTTGGALTLGTGSSLTVTGTAGASAYDIATYSSLTAGSVFTTVNIPAGYSINYAGTSFGTSDIELDVTAVPEPSTWVGALLVILGAFGIKLRRKVR